MQTIDWVNIALTCLIVIGGYTALFAIFYTLTKSDLNNLKKDFKKNIEDNEQKLNILEMKLESLIAGLQANKRQGD